MEGLGDTEQRTPSSRVTLWTPFFFSVLHTYVGRYSEPYYKHNTEYTLVGWCNVFRLALLYKAIWGSCDVTTDLPRGVHTSNRAMGMAAPHSCGARSTSGAGGSRTRRGTE